MKKDRPKLVVITGPTASGKSSLAVNLALHFGGEIINTDSMQVYRGMNVGTAKLSVEERKGVVHHMIDVVDPDEEFNALSTPDSGKSYRANVRRVAQPFSMKDLKDLILNPL